MLRRRFTLDDQLAFAELSGDWNPMHVDPVHARRLLFGEPVVHGVHLLLWALDEYAARNGEVSFARISATFRKPLFVDQEVELELGEKLVANARDQRVLELTFDTIAPTSHPTVSDDRFPRSAPRDAAIRELAGARGETPVVCNASLAAALFPELSKARSNLQVAELLAATRIVGMQCPGLHSIFSRLELSASTAQGERISYRVRSAVEKYSLVQLAIEGPTLAGTLDTFVRPRPTEIRLDEIRGRVPRDRFIDRRALVIGGSRGLGEAFAKILGVGGAQVHLTYRTGVADAERVSSEIAATCSCHDALTGPLELPWTPTHVYYFATPKIRIGRDETFSADELRILIDHYVVGLERTVRACDRGDPFMVFSPSTVFLDQAERGAAAYCVAKAAMEELGRRLPENHPVTVLMPRLPRIATDQTASLIAIPAADPIEVALSQLAGGA